VQTNIIFFVSYEDGILTIMEALAEHDCCSEAHRNVQRIET
jgi:hypothetical protein